MPQQSRYSDKLVEKMLNELTSVLEKHKTPVDLSLTGTGKYGHPPDQRKRCSIAAPDTRPFIFPGFTSFCPSRQRH